MQTRRFDNIGKDISLLGFGCMRLPRLDDEAKSIDYDAAERLIDTAYKAGVNYFDTAYPYHEGTSETFIGKALSKYPRESFNLASKMPTWNLSTPERIEEIFAEQLQKCQVEYFDFYLMHAMGSARLDATEKVGMYDILKRKKDEGKIKRLGFSFHDTPEALERILAAHEWDFVQIQLNYLDWDMIDARRLYEIIKAYGVPAVIMEPVRGGALATLNDEACSVLKAANPDASIASWAIRFAASLDNVMCVLSGMSNEEQVLDNIKTMTDFKPLTEDEYAAIRRAVIAYQSAGTIPCTACRYCMDCLAGVNIPAVFAVYNRYCTTKNEREFKNNYGYLGETHQAHNCVSCGKCAKACPQHIDIPARMREVNEFYESLKESEKA